MTILPLEAADRLPAGLAIKSRVIATAISFEVAACNGAGERSGAASVSVSIEVGEAAAYDTAAAICQEIIETLRKDFRQFFAEGKLNNGSVGSPSPVNSMGAL